MKNNENNLIWESYAQEGVMQNLGAAVGRGINKVGKIGKSFAAGVQGDDENASGISGGLGKALGAFAKTTEPKKSNEVAKVSLTRGQTEKVWVSQNNQSYGPYKVETIEDMVKNQQLSPDAKVYTKEQNWVPLNQVEFVDDTPADTGDEQSADGTPQGGGPVRNPRTGKFEQPDANGKFPSDYAQVSESQKIIDSLKPGWQYKSIF